jgi:hypothetical protein
MFFSTWARDESIFFSERQVRDILGRLSSTDRRLRLRVRLAGNPGSTGAGWHKTLFLRGKCPVHSDQSAVSGQLYWDGRWPSDRTPIGKGGAGLGSSVAFIPGRLTDHSLLDPGYLERLQQMSGSLANAMAQGCWCALAGAYFSNWDANRMVVPYGSLELNWWDHYFISLDFGFGQSAAAAHLHVRTQQSKTITIGEFVDRQLPAYQFAEEVARRFVLPLVNGQRRKILAVYLDPSNFSDRGDGSTIASQINEVLSDYDLGAISASNDRIGGWQRLYQMLQTGEWLIAETCQNLIEAIPHPDARRKEAGGPQESNRRPTGRCCRFRSIRLV